MKLEVEGLQLQLGPPPVPPLGVVPDRVTSPHPAHRFNERQLINIAHSSETISFKKLKTCSTNERQFCLLKFEEKSESSLASLMSRTSSSIQMHAQMHAHCPPDPLWDGPVLFALLGEDPLDPERLQGRHGDFIQLWNLQVQYLGAGPIGYK